MFEQLIEDVASRSGVGNSSAASLLREVLSMMTDDDSGGINGFIDQFRRAGLGNAVDSWIGKGSNLLLTEPQLESAIGRSTISRLASSIGMDRGVIGAALAALLPKLIDLLTPDGRLPTTADLRSKVAGFLEVPEPARRTTESVRSTVSAAGGVEPIRRRGSLRWLPWVAIPALAVLAWLLLSSPAGTIDPTLAVNNTGDEVTFTGQVGDESARSTIIEALNSTFGADNVSGDVNVSDEVKEADWLPQVEELVSALNTPGAEFELTGDRASVGGWLSEADRANLTERVHGVLGDEISITELGDKATEAVREANARAAAALAALSPEGASAEEIVAAMNLSVVNFPSGSATIPADAAELIQASAEALLGAPEGTEVVVAGHTDNAGDADANMTLSLQRAEAVVDALVAAGVDEAMLKAEGYGDTQPVASNDTEYGRFQNRRIEYAVAGAEEMEEM